MLRVVGQSERPDAGALYLRTAEAVRWGDGFYGDEVEGERAFHWMGLAARFEFAPAAAERFLEFSVYGSFYDLSQVLEAGVAGGGAPASFALTYDWMRLSVPIPPSADAVRAGAEQALPACLLPGRLARARGAAARAVAPCRSAPPRTRGAARTPTRCSTGSEMLDGRHSSSRPRRRSASTCTASATSSRRASTASGT